MLIGSSRTDAGVHARGFVANFKTSSSIPSSNIPLAINTKLPKSIAVIGAEDADLVFHSRYSSIGKIYSYSILNRRMPSPTLRYYTVHISSILDVELMKKASDNFLGTHDFSAFKSSGSSVKDNVRTVSLLNVNRNGDIINIEIKADGFLYNMVRIISGTLIDVGRRNIDPKDIPSIIESRNREKAGKTAPAQGLCLEEVLY
jgi:tRNA pseudouridine38-40 synthase